MRLLLLSLVLISSFSAQAKIKSFNVENLHIDFQQDNGRAAADLFSMKFNFGKLDLDGYDIDIQKGEGSLLFSKQDTRFRLDGIDQSVLDAVTSLSAQRIDISGEANKSLKLDFKHGAISLGDEIHGLRELNVDCFTNTRGDDTLVSFLIPCFDDGKIVIPEFILGKKLSYELAPLWLSTPASHLVSKEKAIRLIPNKIENIRLNILKQVFNLSMQARFIFKLTLKIDGSAELNQKKNIAVFNIQKAKIGFINVKKILINLLSKLTVTNVTVEGSKITIKL